MTPRTEWYVVQTLASFTRDTLPTDEPLALRLVRSRKAPTAEKARELRSLGDTALVVSGFFAESLRNTLVEPSYYVAIGEAAYGEAGTLLRVTSHRRELAEVLEEMSGSFARLVAALAGLGEESVARGLNVGALFERWLRTGSRAVEKQLLAHGVMVKTKPPETA
ncbi:MAG: hypothetical protein AABZ30_07800 [Myxococcota bacterium]